MHTYYYSTEMPGNRIHCDHCDKDVFPNKMVILHGSKWLNDNSEASRIIYTFFTKRSFLPAYSLFRFFMKYESFILCTIHVIYFQLSFVQQQVTEDGFWWPRSWSCWCPCSVFMSTSFIIHSFIYLRIIK